MLCPDCRRQVLRGDPFCGACGAPLGHAEAPLELVLSGGRRLALVGDVVIGRAPGSTLQLDDPSVSRRHARIRYDGERWLVADLGSLNGTRLNGWRISEETEIRPGDRLSLGPARFRLTAPR